MRACRPDLPCPASGPKSHVITSYFLENLSEKLNVYSSKSMGSKVYIASEIKDVKEVRADGRASLESSPGVQLVQGYCRPPRTSQWPRFDQFSVFFSVVGWEDGQPFFFSHRG